MWFLTTTLYDFIVTNVKNDNFDVELSNIVTEALNIQVVSIATAFKWFYLNAYGIRSLSIVLQSFGSLVHSFIPVNAMTKLLCPVLLRREIGQRFNETMQVTAAHTLIFVYVYTWVIATIANLQTCTILPSVAWSTKGYRKHKKQLKLLGLK